MLVITPHPSPTFSFALLRTSLSRRLLSSTPPPLPLQPPLSLSDSTNQFARMDAAFLSWVFELRDSEGALLGIIDRNFSGFAREVCNRSSGAILCYATQSSLFLPYLTLSHPIQFNPILFRSRITLQIFTDTGHYVLRMDGGDGINASIRPMTLDERAVALAAAITVDFDYFSRHSQHGM